MPDYEQEPQISPGLLYALVAMLRGQPAPQVPVTQGAMGIAGSAGPGGGFRGLRAMPKRGPQVEVPPELSQELGGGFGGRTPTDLTNVTQQNARPWVGEYPATAPAGTVPRVVSKSAANPNVYNLGTEASPYGDLASQVRGIPAPPVDLNNPAILRNKALLDKVRSSQVKIPEIVGSETRIPEVDVSGYQQLLNPESRSLLQKLGLPQTLENAREGTPLFAALLRLRSMGYK